MYREVPAMKVSKAKMSPIESMLFSSTTGKQHIGFFFLNKVKSYMYNLGDQFICKLQ